MSLRRWLREGRLREHQTNRKEIRELLAMVERDLEDASIDTLSTDRRFLIAYEAALTLATIPLYSAGYETRGRGHHWLTFQLLPEVMGSQYSELADYFEFCRTKRNVGTYDRGGQIGTGEVAELMEQVDEFREHILAWLGENHPDLLPA